ncbi:bacterioferritin [Thalassotalea agarivorans]|uniref:Bacterioferritin n=1 Tax=Thalassotalea agarivorans TaxID=349064 RepID=A0A1I0BHW4_THASX|nr:bacterioferritin [Thalassotalea agarivorans]SET06586.1 bacterioferritin [Thalassotalea agarivorans]
MKSQAKVVSHLNKVLTVELTSINQYFLHARMYKNWGISQLNDKCYKKSILDMKQADKLIERILFLEGLPNLQQLGKLAIGEETKEMLDCDYSFQLDQLPVLKAAIAYCEEQQDYVSRDILVEILEGEEEYIDFLEVQQYQIENIGMEKYIQSQL